jgi:hypothetical protein
MKKEEITQLLLDNKNAVLQKIELGNREDFYQSKNEKWSQAEHLEHLVKSIKPINQLFLLPKISLKLIWGKPNRPSRSYSDLVKRYNERLAQSTFPNGNPFGPDNKNSLSKSALIEKFSNQYEQLAKKITNNWSEESLEKYLIPHPLLGKLTVREMLMFTAYHTEHHSKLL